jgi:hypothetical protein
MGSVEGEAEEGGLDHQRRSYYAMALRKAAVGPILKNLEVNVFDVRTTSLCAYA